MNKKRQLEDDEDGLEEALRELDDDSGDAATTAPSEDDLEDATLHAQLKSFTKATRKARRLQRRTATQNVEPSVYGLNYVNILMQALTTKDAALLDDCVYRYVEPATISQTLRDLPLSFVTPLLHELTQRLLTHPLRINVIGPWLKALLRHNKSYVASTKQLREKDLQAILDHVNLRLRDSLLTIQLLGRVEDALALRQALAERESKSEVKADPLLHYVET